MNKYSRSDLPIALGNKVCSVGKLFDPSRDVLLITDSEAASSSLAGFIARRFELDWVAICLPRWSRMDDRSATTSARH
jgi:hypothetical protein